MRVRDAVEADAAAVASMTGRPSGVVRDMIHDRSVRVATTEEEPAERDDGGDAPADADGDETPVDSVEGFVAFDVRDGTVHVTNFEGGPEGIRRLFEEPVGFAIREGMTVEAVVPVDGTATATVEAIGFEAVGSGPRIDGASTTRYRFDPGENEEE
ncbi:hypothetical protein [Halorubrum tebenquichense]|uniref:N-acetyltransferase domain-containing protein n=1 Tax=Halorubrum tebenquichense DSM 14210 TaxID=1227485 RepID=M0DU00_9EURY|nr:hypothetical protein [Halorubrum tebenquichense]ELZ38162.1 hypothetical protein C472_07405 [Halorubrum tebenquichense DSM 14210]